MQHYARACPLIVSSNNMLSPATRQVATQEYAARPAFPAKNAATSFFFLPTILRPFLHFVRT